MLFSLNNVFIRGRYRYKNLGMPLHNLLPNILILVNSFLLHNAEDRHLHCFQPQ